MDMIQCDTNVGKFCALTIIHFNIYSKKRKTKKERKVQITCRSCVAPGFMFSSSFGSEHLRKK
ncbi:hypothetical protein HanIR_Chr03g0141511 [Helianthus annuus]|nr:hypothetical protein HanIR_Chr03g0141511 [Helianthus annuus]